MRRLLLVPVFFALALGCGGVDKKPYQDLNNATAGYAAELGSYWDADVKAGKHEAAWAEARKAKLKAYLDAMNAAVK